MSSKEYRNAEQSNFQYNPLFNTDNFNGRPNVAAPLTTLGRQADDTMPRPTFISTGPSRPIPIPVKRLSSPRVEVQRPNQPATTEERPITNTRRKRGESVQFREVQWGRKGEVNEEAYQRRPASPVRSISGSSKHKSQKDTGSGIFRRTSMTCRNKFQKAITSKSRRPSIDAMEGLEGPVLGQEHMSHNSHSKGLLDRLSRPNKMLSNLKPSRYDTPQPVSGAAAAQSMAVVPSSRAASGQGYDTQLPSMHSLLQMPPELRGGNAARKAAAAFNTSRPTLTTSHLELSHHEIREQNRRRLGSLSSAADSGADLGSCSDVEMFDAVPDLKLDPLSYLPAELTTLVFSYLDADSLRACQKIGPWSALASDPLIWKGEYLRKFQKESYVTPAPIQIGGVGIGKPDRPRQDWETMHQAREQINKNWAAGKGRAIYMAGHTDSVYCVQFDEQKIITGSRDRTIRVWDLNTNRCVKVIGGPTVRPVPGPRVLRTVDYPSFHHAEASVNGTPYGHQIYHVPSDFHSASILCLQYDEEILVTGSSDNDLIVWDVSTYEPIQRLKQHQGGVLDVAFDADHIVSCSKDCTIVVWDRKTLKPLRTLTGHNGPVNAVQLRGNLLVSASGDGVARLWDLTKMECVREFPAKERGLAAVEFSDDAKYVLAGGNDHVTYKFDVATGAEVLQYTGHTQLVRSLFLDTQNKRVVSGSYDLDLRVYDYETGELTTVFQEWTTSWMLAAKCDYRRIVSTSQDGRILLIDFGINQDGRKIPGVDLLCGNEPWKNEEL